MRSIRSKDLGRKTIAGLAALTLSALAAPLALGAGHASATPEGPAPALRLASAEAAPAPKADTPAPCLRKVRVVYGGYGNPAEACAAR